MSFNSYLYSDRFRSPRGLFDANLLCPPGTWTNDFSLCSAQPHLPPHLQSHLQPPLPPHLQPCPFSSQVNRRQKHNTPLSNDDSAYLWRMRIYPNGSTKKSCAGHISIYLEAIQTLFEKQNFFFRRSVQFKFLLYRLIKSTSLTDSSNRSDDNYNSSSTFSRHNSLIQDSSKERPELIYEGSLQKWDFEFHGINSTYGFPTLGTFHDLFPFDDININEVDLVVRVHIYNNNSFLPPFSDLSNPFYPSDLCSSLFSPASFEKFFNSDSYYDVAFTFENDDPPVDIPSSSPPSPTVDLNSSSDSRSDSKSDSKSDSRLVSRSDSRIVSRFDSRFDSKSLKPSSKFVRTIKAHRIILVQRSEYFEKFLGGGWKEGSLKTIPIKHIPFETFRSILYYLYTFKLDDNLDFSILKDVYTNADMMRLEQLSQLVADRIIRMVDYDNWDQVLDLGWKSNSFGSKLLLKNAAYDFIHSHWSDIKNTENMSSLLHSATVDCIEELMEAKMFGPPK
ncbi:19825_t:CDS:1 [Racocetra fulgida]|uniref:19825_t:CDS:1 n=1 Tax=Racocetra fulgida TaxID=60492 RepID=A0A9N8Z0J6_9GLOM|nr:19825_t:CDS:1 [Racocetra fulgida]